MSFNERYTTEEKKAKEPEKEKDKIIISNDAYVLSEILELLIKNIRTWKR